MNNARLRPLASSLVSALLVVLLGACSDTSSISHDSDSIRSGSPLQTLASRRESAAARPRITGGNQRSNVTGGILDTSFGTAGIAVHDGAGGGVEHDRAQDVAVDHQGRIVAVGHTRRADGLRVMALWRYTANGHLDTTFNQTGFVVHAAGAANSSTDDAMGNSLLIDPNGKILVAGYSITGGSWGIVLWRFNPDGTLDTSFSDGGVTRYPFRQGAGSGVALAPNGKIRAAGYIYEDSWDATLWRYDADGVYDQGVFAVFKDHSQGGDREDTALDLAYDANGRIVMVGSRTNAAGNADMTLWRFNDDGTPDTSFGVDGVVDHSNAAGGSGADLGFSLALDASGRIVVVGYSTGSGTAADLAIWRYMPNGRLDTSFNGRGYVVQNGAGGGNGNDFGSSVAIDHAGRILVAGDTTNANGDLDMAVWRYKQNGLPDSAFGGGKGFIVKDGSAGRSGGRDGARSVAIDAQGRIVVAGLSTNDRNDVDMTLWRLLP